MSYNLRAVTETWFSLAWLLCSQFSERPCFKWKEWKMIRQYRYPICSLHVFTGTYLFTCSHPCIYIQMNKVFHKYTSICKILTINILMFLSIFSLQRGRDYKLWAWKNSIQQYKKTNNQWTKKKLLQARITFSIKKDCNKNNTGCFSFRFFVSFCRWHI